MTLPQALVRDILAPYRPKTIEEDYAYDCVWYHKENVDCVRILRTGEIRIRQGNWTSVTIDQAIAYLQSVK